MSGPFVYVGTWTLKGDKLEEGRKYLAEHCAMVEANEPRLIAFHVFLDESGRNVSVVQLHPDSASMEFHMKLLTEHLTGAFDYIESITSEQYFGDASDELRETLRAWESPEVVTTWKPVHQAGFTRTTVR
jgi:hypothetical protein